MSSKTLNRDGVPILGNLTTRIIIIMYNGSVVNQVMVDGCWQFYFSELEFIDFTAEKNPAADNNVV